MSVRVQLSGQMVVFAGTPVVEVDPAESVHTLLEELVRDVPALREALFESDGTSRPTTLVAINGQQVQDLARTPVPDGSEVLLLMPMAGG